MVIRASIGHGDFRSGGGIEFHNSNATLVNVVVSNNLTTSSGGGIYCDDSNLSFSNVTIVRNTAAGGGGICFRGNSQIIYDPFHRSNIYFNNGRKKGCDLFAIDTTTNITVVLDTFTVMTPTDYYAYPLHNFTFDILHAKVEPVYSNLYVNPNGDNNNSGISPAEALKTIDFALRKILADSLNPHIIYLANGIYSPLTTDEKFPLRMRDYISLYGESKTGVILDANSQSQVLELWNDRGVNIESLTITGGGGSYGGGGISCSSSNPIFSNMIITGNKADGGGGGIFFYNDHAILSNVIICNNYARFGGGVWCRHSAPILLNVSICDNSAISEGGGLYCDISSKPSLVNSIIWYNLLGSIHTDIGDTVDAFYSDIQGGWPGVGNIEANPMFVDTSLSDYRLLEGSPCIDKGVQDTMIVYNNGQDTLIVPAMTFMGSAPDMGAYEFDPATRITSQPNVPLRYSLDQNYPNPFNLTTVISYQLPVNSKVDLSIYNLLGQKVATLVNKKQPTGGYQVEWDAINLSTGVYYYKLQTGEFQQVKKMILMK